MATLRLHSVCLGLLLCAVGCASVPDVAKTTYVPPPQSSELATVYLLRQNSMPTALTARIQVNGKKIALLPDDCFTWIQVPPGQTRLEAAFNPASGVKTAALDMALEASQTYYIRYSGAIPSSNQSQVPVIAGGRFLGMASTSSLDSWNELRAVDEPQGRAFLTSFAYVAAQTW